MRVFVTGATGYIGTALVREFVAAGHEVTGLFRTDAGARRFEALGVRPVLGELADPATYEAEAEGHDVLVHAAADPSPARIAADRTALETLLWAAREGARPRSFLYTSGVFSLGDTGGSPADESAAGDGAAEVVRWRAAHESRVLEAAAADLATAVIRPGMVYGGGRGTISGFFATAERDGAAAYVGDGANRWPLVHREDAARLYRLVAERGARGVFHAVDGSALAVREIARLASEAAGRGGATRSIPLDQARRTMGGFADALCMDMVVVGPRAAALGWRPELASFAKSAADAHREWKAAQPVPASRA